jgi:hypothetical protein
MSSSVRKLIARTVILSLALWVFPAPVALAGSEARLEGRVLDLDGRPADGFRVHLIDGQGEEIALSETDADGVYSFPQVPAGNYGIGVANAEGQVAPVAGPPLRLADGQLARRDLKLVQTDVTTRQQTANANYSLGMWWAGLSTPAKTGLIVAVVVAAWVTIEALSSDNNERAASPI